MTRLLLSLVLPLLCAATWTRSTTEYFGKITEIYTGEALFGAVLQFSNTDTTVSARTDVDGGYRVQLPVGTYQLRVTFTGFKEQTINGLVASGQTQPIELNVSLSGEMQLSEVVVIEKATVAKKEMQVTTYQMSAHNVAPRDNYKRPGVYHYDNYHQEAEEKPKASGGVEKRLQMQEKSHDEILQNVEAGNVSLSRRAVFDTVQPATYKPIVENAFVLAEDAPVSTFGIDVDAASYANVRNYLNDGERPPVDAVRMEELINYFDYHYPQPTGNDPIRIVTELNHCPWQPEHHLLMVGLQARSVDLADVPPGNFVFLVDVSGSMSEDLELVKESLLLLLEQMRPQDHISIVTYAGATEVVLPSTSGSDKAAIRAVIQGLDAGGGTAGGAGIQLAYQQARAHFNPQGNNRVLLCTDGDFNVGLSSEEELVQLIEKERESGVYLTVLGFGDGGYQDSKMQELADHGNGNHAYIDQIGEAKKVLVRECAGTLYTLAKDVKLQLEFNPDQVAEYRLIGYENRLLRTEDFDDDTKDAGELGAGHTVTALYEIVPNTQSQRASSELVHLKFRYQQPTGKQKSRLVEQKVPAVCAARVSNNFQMASAVAAYGLLLRNSPHRGTADWALVDRLIQACKGPDPEGYRVELAQLAQQASKLK